MDDKNKGTNNESDFFNDDKTKENTKQDKSKTNQSEYYSYGSFKPTEPSKEAEYTSYSSHLGESSDVEINKPKEVSIYGNQVQNDIPNKEYTQQEWTYSTRKKRSSFKSMFAAFMSGVLIVGGLMVASDKLNLFSSDNPPPDQAVSQNIVSAIGSESQASIDFENRPDNIADIVEQASPAVVKIETYTTQSSNSINRNEDIFRYFFGDELNSTPDGGPEPSGLGSGFIFDEEGYILTNEHVVSGSDEIYVELEGYEEKFKAELLGSSYDLDLAVLKIEGSETFPTLEIGNSDELRVGDWVTAIGNPVGFDHSVSVGVLSANEREISIPDSQGTRTYEHLLQTDASINPGNSGGPLIDLNGEVIGINTAVSTDAQGIGFAIPTSTIDEVLDDLKNNVTIPKPYIGVGLNNINDDIQRGLNLESKDGVHINQVERQSPAHLAGLQPNDVIIEFNGESIKNADDLIGKVKETEVGESVNLTFIRQGKTFDTIITIGDRNAD
ncbi:S1C family serine protease [Chengkuizengella axinellae]|uniref:Trypsin-like peptidase domain-containing protein n=1 Tax=Chengkuizengella axinellae TaxID=3064388 RepID=A0ABT9J0L8_9BACL|nr:trypsin-like peptidase domain-containing protein [Chengkuizengella sp. 2205SS18-9]MDP5275176.1 trypsin-like peptidase domain-containing protein [Chengkuizengella sp. 2205SS18-9]